MAAVQRVPTLNATDRDIALSAELAEPVHRRSAEWNPLEGMELRMPWTADQPPVSMRHLPPPVRRKAVEIANALLRERMEEGKAIRIATAKARAWALQQKRQRGAEEGIWP
jgi:hypothetical protein